MRLPAMDSAVGGLIKVALWAGGSAAVAAVAAQVSNNPELYSPLAVVVVNILGKFAKDWFDKNKANY